MPLWLKNVEKKCSLSMANDGNVSYKYIIIGGGNNKGLGKKKHE
jgi:hypothetical protein